MTAAGCQSPYTGRAMRIHHSAYSQLRCALYSRVPEAGGLLLGPIGEEVVTLFHFDAGAICTGSTYTPDHLSLRALMQEVWLPGGLDMKGFAHSHPGGYDRLSPGDLAYIGRLLAANPDMDRFLAPVVVPSRFRVCPFIVERGQPGTARLVPLEVV